MENLERRLAIVSHISTIIAGLVATLALSLGYFQYIDTSERQSQEAAFRMFLKYLEVKDDMIKYDSDGGAHYSKVFGNYVVVTAERIYLLRSDDEGWTKTVQSIIREFPADFADLQCKTFDDDFISVVESELGYKVCNVT